MKHCMDFAKGMGAGIIVGLTAAGALKYACQNNRKIRRTTGKATKAISQIMEDIQSLVE